MGMGRPGVSNPPSKIFRNSFYSANKIASQAHLEESNQRAVNTSVARRKNPSEDLPNQEKNQY